MSDATVEGTAPAGPPGPRRAWFLVVALTMLNVLGMGIIFPVLPFITLRYVSGRSLALWVGVLESVNAFCAFLVAPFLGGLSDRIGRRPILILGAFGAALGYVLFGDRRRPLGADRGPHHPGTHRRRHARVVRLRGRHHAGWRQGEAVPLPGRTVRDRLHGWARARRAAREDLAQRPHLRHRGSRRPGRGHLPRDPPGEPRGREQILQAQPRRPSSIARDPGR